MRWSSRSRARVASRSVVTSFSSLRTGAMMEKLLKKICSPDDGFWDTLVVLSLTEGEDVTALAPETQGLPGTLRRPKRVSPPRPEIRP